MWLPATTYRATRQTLSPKLRLALKTPARSTGILSVTGNTKVVGHVANAVDNNAIGTPSPCAEAPGNRRAPGEASRRTANVSDASACCDGAGA